VTDLGEARNEIVKLKQLNEKQQLELDNLKQLIERQAQELLSKMGCIDCQSAGDTSPPFVQLPIGFVKSDVQLPVVFEESDVLTLTQDDLKEFFSIPENSRNTRTKMTSRDDSWINYHSDCGGHPNSSARASFGTGNGYGASSTTGVSAFSEQPQERVGLADEKASIKSCGVGTSIPEDLDLQPCRQLNEKEIIAEMVQTASKSHKGTTEAFEPWLLYFHMEAVSKAYESRQVKSAYNTAVTSAILVVSCCILRLSRVALGIEIAFGAYGTMQIGVFLGTMLVHLGILCCVFCIRKMLSHVRLIQALVALSCISCTIGIHLVATEVLASNKCAPVEVWLVVTLCGYAAQHLAVQASVSVYVHSLVGVVVLQPVLVSPHIEPAVRWALFVVLVVISGCNYQTEKARRMAFVHELEVIISEQEGMELDCKLARTNAKNMRLEEKIRDTELLLLHSELGNEGLRSQSMQTAQFDARVAREENPSDKLLR